jgi:hypothetical protein
MSELALESRFKGCFLGLACLKLDIEQEHLNIALVKHQSIGGHKN